MKVIFFVLFCLIQFSSAIPASLECKALCPFAITYDLPEFVCSYNGVSYKNTLCPYGVTFATCTQTGPPTYPNMTADLVVNHVGHCGCPSNCSSTFRGSCNSTSASHSSCICSPGYSGIDCSSITCDQQFCSNHGTCQVQYGQSVCLCDPGYSGIDCSGVTPLLPAIIPAFGSATPPQYTSKDQYGDANPLFDESIIGTIWLELPSSDLEWIMNPYNAQTKEYKKATFQYYNGNISIAPMTIGLRIKGGASRNFIKKSWKISFNEFVSKQKLFQQKKLLLKAGSMEGTYLRERLSRDLIYSMGAATERMAFSNLYINGEYRGLYIQMDAIDDVFLTSRFGSSDGGLWKISPAFMPTLLWQGPECANYSIPTEYQPNNDFATDNCQVLVHLIDVLNNAPDETFETDVQQIFDVGYFLRTLVVEVLTGNWDGGSYDGNNYYLYYDVSTTPSLFKYIRQDLDLSWGSQGSFSVIAPQMAPTLETGSIYTYGSKVFGKILTQRILNTPSFRQLYNSYMSSLMTTYFNLTFGSTFMNRLTTMYNSVNSSVQQDYWHRLDMGMTYQDYLSNVYDTPIVHSLYTNLTSPEILYDLSSVLYLWGKSRYQSAAQELGLP